jgi:hypothetical protein
MRYNMRNWVIISFILPILLFSHIKDERLFKTLGVPSSAMLLLDRSGSMERETERYYTLVTLNNYSPWDHRTRLAGWYDDEITPDGPGEMKDFKNEDSDSVWTLRFEWNDPRENRLFGRWTLKIKVKGSWYTFDGGSFSWTGWWSEERESSIRVSDLGKVQEVECFVDISTDLGLEIGEVKINLIHRPGYSESTRIKDAILVIHSLLDADNNGYVEEADEEFLPINLGYGFHRESRVYIPPDYFRRGEIECEYFDEQIGRWREVELEPGRLYSDTISSSLVDIWNHINYTDVGGYTPNGVLIARTSDYINDWRNEHPDLWCMAHNIILITDGETNNPREECNEGSKDVVRQAYRAWHEDSIRVYAVGFGSGITERGANELNWVAKWGGTQKEDQAFIDSMVNIEGMDTAAIDPRGGCPSYDPQDHSLIGYAYIAEDAEALSSALAKIFMEISGMNNISYAAGEVTSVQEELLSTQYEGRLFLALFNPDSFPIWEGDLRALKLDVLEFLLDSIPPEIIIWSAKDSLKTDKSANNRNIYGIKADGRMLPFNESNFDSSDFKVNSSNMARDIIDRIRDGLENDNMGELGDIFHSSPLRIHTPNYFYMDQGYDQFYIEMRERSPLIYAGANDGMLHVFADSVIGVSGRGGEEIAGIIPMNFIPRLKILLNNHDYFVDADPMAADVWFPQNTDDSVKEWNEWHTILIAPQGEGGRSFTVINVTDPLGETPHPVNTFQFLFNAMQSKVLKDTLGYTTSVPKIHKVGIQWETYPNRKIDRFFVFMGGGQWPEPMDIALLDSIFSGGEVEGNCIIAMDLFNVIENGINGNEYLIPPTARDAALMDVSFPASPTLFNMDPEMGNRSDFLFIPDALGQLWFVDLRNPDPYSWEAECIFIPELPTSSDSSELVKWHPAFYRPLVWKDPTYGDYWVIYGTGNRSDIFIPSEDRIYALRYPEESIENHEREIPVYNEDNLGVPGIATNAGWMLELQHENEKVVTPAIYYLDSVKIFTFTPGSSEGSLSPCEIGGAGSLARAYSFHIRTGGTSVIGGIVTGTGMPQPTRYSYSLDGTGMLINQVSGKLIISEGRTYRSFKQIVKWKEE